MKNTEKKNVKKKTEIQPLGNRVLIRPFTKEEVTKKNSFGIILPDSDSKQKMEQGTVLAVGPGVHVDGKLVSVSVKKGDIVAFSKYGFDDIEVDGEMLYLIKEENVLAVLE
ncbi:MAG: co-chaperone GroES [Minisyncoccota bacterium]